MRKIILFGWLYLLSFIVIAQTDTAFWFAPTYVAVRHANGPVFLRLANSTNQASTVRIYTPANPSGMDLNRTVPANGNISVDITSFLDVLVHPTPDSVKRTGIKIESQRNITAYYEVTGRNLSSTIPDPPMQNPEIFVLKGENALGNTFFIPAQNFWKTDNNPDSDFIDGKTLPGWFGGQARSTIDIVATQNNTMVTITPSNPYRRRDGTVNTDLTPFNVPLNRGEVYTLEAAFWAPDQHLGGTKITSTKPIAVTDKDDTVKEGGEAPTFPTGFGYDLLGDQLVPANVVGTEYLVVRGYLTANTPTGENDFAFVVPTQNGTYLNVSGANFPGGPFNAGQLIRIPIDDPAVRIFSASSASASEADPGKPIYVYHVTGVENELASAILPSTNCSGSSSVTFSRTDLPSDNLNFYVNIIVRDGGENSFVVDGVPATNLGFSQNIGGWRYARILNTSLFPVGTHTVSNSSAVFHLAIFFGGSQKGASYGYFSDFGSFKIDLGLDRFNCADNKVSFQLDNYPSIQWTSSTFSGTRTTNPLVAEATGQYFVTITDRNRCRSSDTVSVSYAPEVKITNFDKNRPVCVESDDPARTALLIDSQYDKYKWIRPNGDSVVGTDLRRLTPLSDGLHKIIVTNFYTLGNRNIACSASDEVNLIRKKNFFNFRGFGDSTLLCNTGNNSITLNMDTLKNAPYFGELINWFKNGTNLNIPNNWIYSITSGGYYKALVRDKDRCFIKDSLYVNYVDQITVSLGGDTLVACFEDSPIQSALELVANPTGNYNYIWTTDNGVVIPNNTLSHKPTKQGNYKLEAIDKNFPVCKGSATAYVIRPVNEMLVPWDSTTIINCDTTKLELCAAENVFKYTWFRNNQLIPNVDSRCFTSFQDSAVYKVEMLKFYSKTGSCKADAEATVKTYQKIEVGLNNGVSAFCPPHEINARVTATPNLGKYEWIPNVSNTNTFIPKEDGRYSLTVTNKDGCKGRGFTNVVLVPPIQFDTLFSGKRVSCWYEPITLKAGTGYKSYQWSGMPANEVPDTTVSSYTPKSSGVFSVIVTTMLGNCKDTATSELTYIDSFSEDVSSDLSICDNKRTTIRVEEPKRFDSFDWYFEGSLIDSLRNKTTFTPAIILIPDNLVSSAVTIGAELGIKGCKYRDNFKLSYFREKKPFEYSVDTCINSVVIFDPGPGFTSYLWKLNNKILTEDLDGEIANATRQSVRVDKPGLYTVDLNSADCGIYQPNFLLNNYPEIKLDLGNDRSFCVGEQYYILNLKDSSANNSYKYFWKDLETNKIFKQNVDNSKHELTNMIYASLGVIDTFGCFKADTVLITVNDDCFTIPNLITPGNKDGQNDTFTIRGMYKGEWAVEIYNRWGDRVYKNESYNNEWGGDNVVDGIYYYSLRNTSRDKEYKGWIQVINN